MNLVTLFCNYMPCRSLHASLTDMAVNCYSCDVLGTVNSFLSLPFPAFPNCVTDSTYHETRMTTDLFQNIRQSRLKPFYLPSTILLFQGEFSRQKHI